MVQMRSRDSRGKPADAPTTPGAKDQLKVQIDPAVHKLLRELCARSRRTPAGQIEFMTIMFHKHALEQRPPIAK